MVGISFFDIIFSFGFSLGPLMLPAGTLPWAHGTVQTCTFQGFLIFLGLASYAYSAMLMLLFVFVVRYNVSDRTLARYAEPFMHAVPIGYYGASSIVGLAWEMYNPSGSLCLVQSFPAGCQLHEAVDCVRGSDNHIAVFGVPMMVIVNMVWGFMVVLCSLVLGWTVARKFYASRKFEFEGGARRDSSRIGARSMQDVLVQCALYAFTFLCQQIWTTAPNLLYLAGYTLTHTTIVSLNVLFVAFFPMQGLFSFLIYLRPRYLTIRRKHLQSSRWFAAKEAVWYPVSPVDERMERSSGIANSGSSSGRGSSRLSRLGLGRGSENARNGSSHPPALDNNPINGGGASNGGELSLPPALPADPSQTEDAEAPLPNNDGATDVFVEPRRPSVRFAEEEGTSAATATVKQEQIEQYHGQRVG